MTNGEPPEEPDDENPRCRTVIDSRLSTASSRRTESLRQANRKPSCSCPKDMDAAEALNIRVWKVNAHDDGCASSRAAAETGWIEPRVSVASSSSGPRSIERRTRRSSCRWGCSV